MRKPSTEDESWWAVLPARKNDVPNNININKTTKDKPTNFTRLVNPVGSADIPYIPYILYSTYSIFRTLSPCLEVW